MEKRILQVIESMYKVGKVDTERDFEHFIRCRKAKGTIKVTCLKKSRKKKKMRQKQQQKLISYNYINNHSLCMISKCACVIGILSESDQRTISCFRFRHFFIQNSSSQPVESSAGGSTASGGYESKFDVSTAVVTFGMIGGISSRLRNPSQ